MDALFTGALVAMPLVALAILALLVRERVHRRRLRALLERLAELEEVWGAVGPSEEPGESGAAEIPTEAQLRGPLSSLISSFRRKMGADVPGPQRLDYRAIRSIYDRLEENVAPSEVANELNVSLRTLQRGLTASLGCSPSELIIGVKMHEAKRRLLEGTYQVQEVARGVGYHDPSHFSRRFKAYYGTSPSQLRTRGRDRVA